MKKPTKTEVFREIKDYVMVTVGLISYAIGWTVFLLPNGITTGGVPGIAAIVYYATGIEMQVTYLIINAILMVFAIRFLGWKFCMKTIYAIAMLSTLLWWFQRIVGGVSVVGDEPFMACVLGAGLCGIGLGIAFAHNGSTGGTDIIAAIVNKYANVSFGRMIMMCDILIISSCYFVFHDWGRVVFGFSTLVIISYVLDMIVNSARQSVQFTIISKKHDEIAERIALDVHRGVTYLNGEGWYTGNNLKVIMVLANKRDSVAIFRLIKDIDPNAFISQVSVIGVYGNGFRMLK
ncbi:YitT family protein [Coprobacter tertius]|uniref:YitT family protein n=1 Tax=Coprobacter tertius TaxID=2944915 RepID=A0ABT1MGE3_9BACT|nr:YitT family protein [Coprobacter tertius]MCP9611431.1 YitT family protein [Coprobacter tertius]